MFSPQNSHRFLQKLKPFFLAVPRRYLSLKIADRRQPISHQNIGHRRRPKASAKNHVEEPKIYAKEKISKIYNILKYSAWDSAREQLENLPFKLDSFTVNQVLKAHPPMEKAWLFFNWAARLRNFKHDQYTYTTMADIFGEAGRISSMMYVFEEMKGKGVKIDVVTYTSLMHWVSNSGDIAGAIELWKEMRGKGCRPTVVTYTACMKILLDHGKVDEAAGVYKEMLECGLAPNRRTYTVIMDHLACCGKSVEALEIFNQMQDAGEHPDKAACNILIEIFSQRGEISAIMKVLEYMKANFLVLRHPVYQKAVEAFKIAGECDALLREVNRHFSEEHSDEDTAESDPKPPGDFDAENALVRHLTSKRNLAAIDSLLAEMTESRSVRLESSVVSKIIEMNGACGRENGVLLAYKYSATAGVDLDCVAYLTLLGLFVRGNSFQKIVEIVDQVSKKGFSLGDHLNSCIIRRLGRGKEAVLAAKVFDLLREEDRGCSVYTALIDAYFASGDSERGLKTFERMKDDGVDVALGTYDVLLGGLEKCGRTRQRDYYMKEKSSMMRAGRSSRSSSPAGNLCDVMFAGGFMLNHTKIMHH
ncbi:pentatricopeptide repeat-containing protein At2g01390 [Andrographis paniculata]|uniref:pentatricopeptide repeat-containing protein At2g01390 n=1 Tax=Andrographis paniculata TaxID=175694 RepID=UPI0021E7C97C|nr:pentatricopeptide repeat-containing protein At2g01390 [Andrographis paniculata]